MLTFFREKKWSYLQEASSCRRGFFFSLRAGFEKKQEPLSGMTVSLPKVDAWIQEFVELHSRGELEPEKLLLAARNFLAAKADGEQAKLQSISIHEERGWGLSWKSSLAPTEVFFESRHFLEHAPATGPADLQQITLVWKKSHQDHFDYFSESLQLLKQTKTSEWSRKKPEKILSATSYLYKIRLESRAQAWTLEL